MFIFGLLGNACVNVGHGMLSNQLWEACSTDNFVHKFQSLYYSQFNVVTVSKKRKKKKSMPIVIYILFKF